MSQFSFPLNYHAYLLTQGPETLNWVRGKFSELEQYCLETNQPAPELIIREQKRWGVADSKELRNIQTARWQAGRRWLVLTCDQITIEAEQALLKTLEEPAADVQLFIIVQSPEQLLPTVRSRCQILQPEKGGDFSSELGTKFLTMAPAARLAFLTKILEEEKGSEVLGNLLTNLEQSMAILKTNSTSLGSALTKLLAARSWARRAHVSPKFIAQFLAVTLPRYSK